MKRSKKEYIAAHHQAAINQGADGRYRTHARDAEGKRCSIAARTLEELEEKLYTFYKRKEEGKEKKKKKIETVGDLAEAWVDSLQDRHLRYWTIRGYKNRVKRYMETLTKMKIDGLTWHDVVEALYELAEKYEYPSRASWDVVLTTFNQIFNYGLETGLLAASPLQAVPTRERRRIASIAINSASRRLDDSAAVFTPAERAQAYELMLEDFRTLRRCYQPLMSLAVIFQMETGLRLGELLALMWQDVDLATGYIYVRRNVDHSGIVHSCTKTAAGIRSVPITATAREMLDLARKYLDSHNISDAPYVFSIRTHPASLITINRRYALLNEVFGKHRSSHAARRTYISTLIDGGVNVQTVAAVAGHSSERTTLHTYLYDCHTKDEQKRRIVEVMDAVPSCTQGAGPENAGK